MQIAPDSDKGTQYDVQDDIAARVRHRFPSIDDLLLELIEEGVVLLRLADLLLIGPALLATLVFVLHLNNTLTGIYPTHPPTI
jgi:hypothetical protein